MTEDQLIQLKIDPVWLPKLLVAFERFSINTPVRQAAFIGQCSHESGNFTVLEENLNYSADALRRVWPGRFPSAEIAQPYHRQPEKIANRVYANRMGNGDEESGDGWRYRGRGLIQLTGKDNYRAAGLSLNADFINEPQLVAMRDNAALVAAWYWKTHGLNELADRGDQITITRKINGGIIGLDDRIAKTDNALTILA